MKNNFPMTWTNICPTDEGHKELYERLSKYKFTEYKYNSMVHDAIDTAVSIIEQDLAKQGYTLKHSTEAPMFHWGEPSPRYSKSQIKTRRKKHEPLPHELHWKLSIPELEERYSKKGLELLLIGGMGISCEQMPNVRFEASYGYPKKKGSDRTLLQGRGRKKQYNVVVIGMSCGWSQKGVSKKLANKLSNAFPRIAENKNLYFGPYGTIEDNTYIDGIQALLMIPEDLSNFSINPLLEGIIELGNIALNHYSK